jgi:hypothetical protein
MALMLNAGYNYVPVAFQGESVKQEVHKAVMYGMSVQVAGKTGADITKDKINAMLLANEIKNPIVVVKMSPAGVQATVKYSVEVSILPFGIYKRMYEFDYTESPSTLMTKQ